MPWFSKPALGTEQRSSTARSTRSSSDRPDVLEHADRADGVVRTVVDVAEVGVTHLDAIAEPAFGDTLAREVGLRLRQRDAHRLHAVVLGRVQQHPAPTAADVEQAHPRFQCELAADELVLVGLRVLERGGVVVPHRARVGERRPEHHLVEVVRHVVVVRDRGGVALARVAPAVQAGLLRRWRQGFEALPPDELGRGRDLTRPEVELLDVVGHGHDVEHVAVDLELAGDVGAAEPELVGRGHDPPEGVRRTHDDRGARLGRSEGRAVVGAERDRDVVTEHVGKQIRDAHAANSYQSGRVRTRDSWTRSVRRAPACRPA